jgi:hypothetical protein
MWLSDRSFYLQRDVMLYSYENSWLLRLLTHQECMNVSLKHTLLLLFNVSGISRFRFRVTEEFDPSLCQ